MDGLSIALSLIEEAQAEKKRFEEYMRTGDLDPMDRLPTKAVINDSLKMARRLLAKEYLK